MGIPFYTPRAVSGRSVMDALLRSVDGIVYSTTYHEHMTGGSGSFVADFSVARRGDGEPLGRRVISLRYAFSHSSVATSGTRFTAEGEGVDALLADLVRRNPQWYSLQPFPEQKASAR